MKEKYSTQMEAARKGVVTDFIREVSIKEKIDTELLMKKMAEGSSPPIKVT